MNVKDLQKTFQNDAALLGDYQSMTKAELANGYCDAEEQGNEPLRSSYFSALMLRYWKWIWQWMKDSTSLRLDDIEFVNWLIDSLNDALYYRSWRKIRHDHQAEKQNEHKEVVWMENPQYVEDPDAADKSIHYFIAAKRGKEYQYYNKDKRKSNVHTYSLDSMIDEDGDYAVNWTGCVTKDKHQYDSPTYLLVNALFGMNETLEGLIIDGMANADTFKIVNYTKTEEIWDEELQEYVEKEFERQRSQFDPRKLVKHLSHLSESYIHNFCKEYDLPKSAGDFLYTKLKSTPNQKLYDLIKKVQIEVTTNPDLKQLIVNNA